MKKIKLIILLLAVLIMSGCEIKYNIELKNGRISEEIIIPYIEEYKDSYVREYYYDIINERKYSSEIIEIDNKKNFVLKSKRVGLDILANNDLTRFCYDSMEVLEQDGTYYIGTSSIFKCMTYDYLDVDKIEINIKTYNKVFESNADKKSYNKHTWIIDENNFHDKNIIFVVSKNEYVWYYKYKNLFLGLLGIVVLIGLGFLIRMIILYMSDRANRI